MGKTKMTVVVDKEKYLKLRGRLLAEGLFVSEWVGKMIDNKLIKDVEYIPEIKNQVKEITGIDITEHKEIANKAVDTYFKPVPKFGKKK